MSLTILTLRMSFYSLLETIRHPSYVVTTLLFPSMFFWFFGVPNAKTPEAAQMLMGSFSSFAVLGVVLFQLTVGVAQDRSSSWDAYLRTLPVPSSVFLFARLSASFVIAILAVGAVILTAEFTTDVSLANVQWLPFLVAVMLGGLPFAALGLVLGMLANPKSAVPIANLVYLPFSFAGGLWVPPNGLAQIVQDISEFLPTRFYGELVWAAASGGNLADRWIIGHGAYCFLFLSLALYLHRRDEGMRFG